MTARPEPRLRAYVAAVDRAAAAGLASLDDAAFLALLSDHRWAVGRLASRQLAIGDRVRLNAAVLKAHGLLHERAPRARVSLGDSLRAVAPHLPLSAGVFLGAALLAWWVVGRDPLLAYAFVPRAFVAQLGADAWGARGGVDLDLGMTFFYWSNNLRATFLALGLGTLGGVLGLAAVGFNGALLGAVAAAAAERGIGHRLVSWILPHAVPELGALVLAGAIGVTLGRALLVPGWRSRAASLAAAGRDVLPMMGVAAALVVAAAPLEGFVAPLALPLGLKALFPLAWTALLVLGARAALAASGSPRRGGRRPREVPPAASS